MNENAPRSDYVSPAGLATSLLVAFVIWAGGCWLIREETAGKLAVSNDMVLVVAEGLALCLAIVSFSAFAWRRSNVKNAVRSDQSEQLTFGLMHNVGMGLGVGILAAAAVIGFLVFDPLLPSPTMDALPSEILSYIGLLIPIAMEVYFRGIVMLQIFHLSQKSDGAQGWDSWIAAVILSGMLFAMFSVPNWYWIENAEFQQIVVKFAWRFGLGGICGILFLCTRSIWAPLFPHWAIALCTEI